MTTATADFSEELTALMRAAEANVQKLKRVGLKVLLLMPALTMDLVSGSISQDELKWTVGPHHPVRVSMEQL
jgi:hypothetical protein